MAFWSIAEGNFPHGEDKRLGFLPIFVGVRLSSRHNGRAVKPDILSAFFSQNLASSCLMA